MKLLDRLKKEMSEGMVRALLEDAGYRVIDTGIEKILREVSPLSHDQYLQLAFPMAMRRLPDLTVFNKDGTLKYLVEVKYRDTWDASLFEQLKDQVEHMEEMILVSINARPPEDKKNFNGPSRYVRCCKIRQTNGEMLVEVKKYHEEKPEFVALSALPTGDALWWSMSLLQDQFPQLREKANEANLVKAVKAIIGILN